MGHQYIAMSPTLYRIYCHLDHTTDIILSGTDRSGVALTGSRVIVSKDWPTQLKGGEADDDLDQLNTMMMQEKNGAQWWKEQQDIGSKKLEEW